MDIIIGSMFHVPQLQILATVFYLLLFLFLHQSVLTFAGNFPTPNNSPPIDNNKLPTSNSVPSPYYSLKIPRAVFFPFGVVNSIATAVIIVITIFNIIVYKLRKLHEANFGKNLDISSSQQLHKENLRKNSNIQSSLKSEQLCRHFSLAEILSVTNNFDDTLVIGHGGFGKVYKGVIDNGTVPVAIKRLNPMSKQGAPQFWTEVKLLSKFRHSHLVSLIGYCKNCDEMILVYEYMARGALADHLFKVRPNGNTLNLSWVQRLKICIGAAQGLDYLHTGTGIPDRVIHRDFKSSNILLDDSWAAKVSDFGLSKIGPANQSSTHVSTNVKGTFGYIDPEYVVTHRLTRKSDVYSFGVVLLELLSGRRALDLKLYEVQWGLPGWAKECIKKGELDQIIDPSLKWQILPNSLTAFVQIADQCLHYCSKKRPTMAEVVASLESALALQERRDYSMFEEDMFTVGGTFDNQENPDYSLGQPEVIDAGNGEHQGEEIDNIVLSGNASSLQSHVRPARMTPFKKMAQLFFFGKSTNSIRKSMVHTTNINSEEDLEVYLGLLKRFSLRELKVATDNFSNKNIKGSGGFCKVYKGRLADGTLVAIKRLKEERTPGGELQFLTEAKMISMAVHRNLLRLRGFCMTPTEWLLVYPYMANGSVASCLRDRPKSQPPLDWPIRKLIALGSARGLAYLHDHCDPKIIHGDVKAANILLDEEFEAVVGDFGLAKLMDCKDSHVTTAATGKCSEKTDVFGYGVMLLELITGQRAFDHANDDNDDDVMLLDWVKGLLKEKKLETVADAAMQGIYIDEEVEQLIQVALLCTQGSPKERPKMSEVVRMLKGAGLDERWEGWIRRTIRYGNKARSTMFLHRQISDSKNEQKTKSNGAISTKKGPHSSSFTFWHPYAVSYLPLTPAPYQ